MSAHLYTQESSSFWDTYAKGRPKVPQSFWSRIFAYHASHGGRFHVANDLGSGVGIHSQALARRFERVILTDPGAKNLEMAEARLSESTSSSESAASSNEAAQRARYAYILGTAESNSITASSIDLVFAANVMHHTNPPVALSRIASLLKPGGTLIMTLFGPPNFSSDRAQDIWERMCNHSIGRLREAHKDNPAVPMDRILETEDSGFDSIAVPEELFEDVKRVKLNTEGASDEPFRLAQSEKERYPLVSRVGPSDQLITEQDEDWAFSDDLEGVRTLWDTFPWLELDEAFMRSLWEEMEQAAEAGRYRGHWVVSIVMATKKVNASDSASQS